MRILDNLKLGIKLPLMLVAIAMVALTIMGVSAYREAYGLLESEGKDRLSRTLAARIAQLESWSKQVQSQARTLAANPTTARALYDFDKSWKRLGEDSAQRLAEAYTGDQVNVDALEGDDLLDFSLQHRRYHPGFEQTVSAGGLADLYLIGRDGRVVYSVGKGAGFGQQLAPESGPLGAVVAQAGGKDTGQLAVSDILTGQGAPHFFIAAPVVSANGLNVGVLALRVPAAPIAATMTTARGLGQTGDGFLIDAKGRLLSPLRFSHETLKPGAQIDLPELGAALADGPGLSEGRSLYDQPAIRAYAPVTLFDRRDIAVVEQDRAELFAPASSLAKSMTFNASWIILLLLGMSTWMARSVARPLQKLGGSIRAIESGDFDSVIDGTTRSDEVGVMATALDSLRNDLASASVAQKEAALQGAAFANSSAAMMLIDRDFRITHANRAVVKLVESQLEEFQKVTPDLEADGLIGRCMDEFHAVPGPARALLEDRARLPFHVDIKVGNGRFGVDVSEICDVEGEQIGLVVEWRDVTQLRMQRALIDAIEENQLVCEADPEGRITRLNARSQEMASVDDGALLGLPLSEMLSTAEGADPWPDVLSGTSVTARFRLRLPDAGEFLIDGSINPVSDRAGRMMKIVLIANDVTQAESDLALARERNEAMIAQQQSVVDALRLGLSALSKGDLSARIDDNFTAEYEALRSDFNAAVDNLASAIRAVIENAAAIDTEAREISSASDDLSRRTEQQAATLEQTAAALDELSSSVSAAAQGVAEADTVVGQARDSAQSSGEIVKQAIQAMSEIESSSQQISKIIGVIDEIAFQTNLLALNAGVEAARAGEAGRGFAVVASEVRALAQRSSEAAREIDALITASSEHVTRGVGLVGETGKALEGILQSVVDISGRVSEIASGAQEQAQGLKEINTAMNQLDQVTQQNAAMFEETTAASHALNVNASALRDTTGQFQIGVAGDEASPEITKSVEPAASTEPESQPLPAPSRAAPVQQHGNALRKPVYNEEDWEDF